MKRFIRVLCLALSVVCLCGCVFAETREDGGLKKLTDGATMTMFKAAHTVIGTQLEDWNESLIFQELEKRTGVHFDFITPAQDTQDVALQLLISSGDLPDIIYGTNGYTGGGEALVNDGVVIDLAQYLDKLPNFRKALEETELRQKEVYTDSGKIPGFPTFYENDESGEVYVGLLLRKDLLDKVGMDVPVTYDDWHNVLKAFKEQCGIKKGFIPGPQMFAQNNMWSIGYDFGYMDYFGTMIPFYQKDGVIRYAPIDDTEAFGEYVQMMRDWYAEGLLDPDFQSVTDVNAQISTYSSPDCAACVTAYSLAGLLESIAQENAPGFDYICVPMPVKEPGQKLHMYFNTTCLDLNQIMITTACKDIDLALAYFDQLYTKEGSLLGNWGVEGITFNYDENGKPQWTEAVVANPDYNFTSMKHYYLSHNMPGVYERRAYMVEADSIANNEMYLQQADNSYRIPSSLTLSEEETQTYNDIMTDINTYVEEKCIRYILGTESMDSFATLPDEIRAMGVEEAMAAYQAALDRYNAR